MVLTVFVLVKMSDVFAVEFAHGFGADVEANPEIFETEMD